MQPHAPATVASALLRATPDALPAMPGERGSADPFESKLKLRTVWISDLHLGTPGCQALALLDFLRHVECETLFLVGDIIDGWQLRRSWYWPQGAQGHTGRFHSGQPR
jgi:hypothetical protein